MGIDAILNAVWLLLGLVALAVMCTSTGRGRSRVLCCIGVALIVAALFPIISATDDIIRIQHLEGTRSPQNRSDSDSHKRTSENLIRLYEAMESPLVATPVKICFTLCFAFLVITISDTHTRQRSVSIRGRSPPPCLA